MRIGIDARELCGRPTGVGRYLAGLLTVWAADPATRRHEFTLYAHEPIRLDLDTRRFAIRVVPGKGGWQWEQMQLRAAVRADKADVFFSPAYTAPLGLGLPLTVAIHDISFVAHPEWFSAREGLRRRLLTRHAAHRARAVITISAFTKGELIDRLGVPASRIHVIPPGIDRVADNGPRGVAPTARRVLYVGSIFNRRHIPELVRGFAQVAARHPGVELDLVGDNRTMPAQKIDALVAEAGPSIRWRQYVSDAELGMLYRQAHAFAFLSEYEGLGLTPLEALAVGVPSLLLDTPVARESCGDAALYIPAPEPRAIAAAIERLVFDEPLRAALLARASETLARYDGRQSAHETLRVIESTV